MRDVEKKETRALQPSARRKFEAATVRFARDRRDATIVIAPDHDTGVRVRLVPEMRERDIPHDRHIADGTSIDFDRAHHSASAVANPENCASEAEAETKRPSSDALRSAGGGGLRPAETEGDE